MIEEIRKTLPELPDARRERFKAEYGLPLLDAEVLCQVKEIADYFEETVKSVKDSKLASNWVMGEVLRILNEKKISISDFTVSPARLGKLISLIEQNVISGKIAKDVFAVMLEDVKDPELIVRERNLIQITDESVLRELIGHLIEKFPSEVQQFREGKEKVLGFFVGQVMRESKGKANPQVVNDLLRSMLQ
jgi:aspartyl-tRNA(Asn)/glutamyl-tRNA(Gln) amidotransferase subunit B